MASVTTYPSHSNVPAYVDKERLLTVLQRQQHEQSTSAPVPTFNYLIDVPISTSDVSRWGTVFAEAEARVRAARDQEEQEEEEGLNSYFFNADLVLNYMKTDEERKTATYSRLAPFPPFDANAVATMPMTKVLKTRREWLPYRQQFPLYQQRTQFLDALLNHDVVALVGAPGSGRTLQTPTILTETEALKRRRVVLVSANAVAARLTSVRLREERGEDAQSRNVAAVLPLHNEATAGSVIVVTTAEVLLRQLLADPLLLDVGCVIFDDVHLRSVETEMCLSLLRERMAHHHAHEAMRKSAEAAGRDVGVASTVVKRLHVFLNCPDEAAAAPLLDFFNAPVLTTSSAYAGVPGVTTVNTPGSTTGTNTVALPPCSTETFVLEGTSGGDASGDTGLVRGGNRFVHYVEELVEWIHKCDTEGKSSLCADPERDLQPHVESVDVVTRVMAAADAEFTNEEKCRSYWCVLIREAIQHYTHAVEALGHRKADGVGTTVMVVAPNATVARLIHDYLKNSLGTTKAAANEEADGMDGKDNGFAFTLLDEQRTDFAAFLAVAQRKAPALSAASAASVKGHIILTTPELAQTVIPPTVPVGLLIDCARTSYRSFDVNAVSDTFATEYTSTQSLRYRRAVGACAKGVGSSSAAAAPGVIEEDADNDDFPSSSRFMTVQLIPKSILHSVQHRRFSADPTQQHPAFRLSFERYLRLYQIFQAKEEAALYARQRAVQAGLASAYLPMTTVSNRIAHYITSNLVAVPSASSGNRYEHTRRVFTLLENYLVAAGHIDIDAVSGSGNANDMCSTMKPLGVLLTLLAGPLPITVSRLLVLSALFSCEVMATAIGAMWIVGDAFNSSVNSSLLELAESVGDGTSGGGKTPAELQEEEEELRALTKEARLFFSRDSVSDVVSGFYVYKMWLSMRGTDPNVVGDDEQAFLDECKVPRRLLLRTEATQARLYNLLSRSGISSTALTTSTAQLEMETKELSAKVIALPDEAALDGKLQAALTGALYPNCAVVEDARDAKTSAMVVMDGLHVISAGRSNATGITVTAKRYGVFSENSVVNDAETAARAVGKPFVFMDRVLGMSATGTHAAHVAILEQATPLQQEASIVFCGEGHVRPKAAPTRCRGWTPCLTQAWRHTRRARVLPPPAQLPTPSIALTPYDTVKAGSVIVSTDDNFQFTMRATTSQWLLQLRSHIQRQLKGFLKNDQLTGHEAAGTLKAFADVADAWVWWGRRKQDGPSWLREERRVRRLAGTDDGRDNTAEDAAGVVTDPDERNLYGFFVFTPHSGVPDTQAPPSEEDRKAKQKAVTTAATVSSSNAEGGKLADGITISVDPNEAQAGGAVAQQQAKIYTGKRPSDDVDEVIRMCVKGIAERQTREHEARLLEDDPVTFGFLNPGNEFHEYYLFRLREAAPKLEVLGDSLDELIQFLEKLEVDLREEIGYKEPEKPAPAYATGGNSAYNDGVTGGQDYAHQQQRQFSEMAGTEAEAYYDGSGGTGLQVETAASVRVKKQSGLNFAARHEPAPQAAAPSSAPAPAAVANATVGGATGTGAPSGQQTLLEKLMAMKNATSPGAPQPAVAVTPESPAPVSTPSASPAAPAYLQPPAHLQQPQQPQNAAVSQPVRPVISTEELLSTLKASLPKPVMAAPSLPQQPAPAGAFKPPSSTEELLALLKGTAPPPAPPTAAPPTMTTDAPQTTTTTGGAVTPDLEQEETTGPARPPPTREELLALLGAAPPTATDASALSLFPTPSEMTPGMYATNGMPHPMSYYGQHNAGGGGAGTLYPQDALFGGPNMAYPSDPSFMYGMQDPQAYAQSQGMVPTGRPQAPKRPRGNPLTKPPPPLPTKAFEDAPASVVVYPLPDKDQHGNTRLHLARSLGEMLDMKVGPTTIVGRVARIQVPNHKVAARALALRKFKCCGMKVYIFKNDRILDDPERIKQLRERRARERGGYLEDRDGNSKRDAAGNEGRTEKQNPRQRPRRESADDEGPKPRDARGVAPEAEEVEGDLGYGDEGDDEDPTSMAFRTAQEHLPAGIEVGAFSDSDSDSDAGA